MIFDGTRATTTFETILTDDQLLGFIRLLQRMANENALLSSYYLLGFTAPFRQLT
jgi:hypothetical protein